MKLCVPKLLRRRVSLRRFLYRTDDLVCEILALVLLTSISEQMDSLREDTRLVRRCGVIGTGEVHHLAMSHEVETRFRFPESARLENREHAEVLFGRGFQLREHVFDLFPAEARAETRFQ